MKNFTVSSLCDNPRNTFYQHIRPHHPSDISCSLSVSHLLQSAHDSPTVLVEAGVQSSYIHRSSGWSPYWSLQPPFFSRHFQHIPQKGELKISV